MVPILDALRDKASHMQETSLRPFAFACSEAYREERKRIIENEVLVDYDIESYGGYMALRSANKELFDRISEDIHKKEEGWNLLIAGFDREKEPHLFVLAERGKIQYCDIQGFAAVGSGQWRAMVELSTYRFNRNLPLIETIYGVMSAKYSAESADGVGDQSMIGFMLPGRRDIIEYPDEGEFDLKYNFWRNIDRIPRNCEEHIARDLMELEAVLAHLDPVPADIILQLEETRQKAIRSLEEMRRYPPEAKPSTSQKSEQEP